MNKKEMNQLVRIEQRQINIHENLIDLKKDFKDMEKNLEEINKEVVVHKERLDNQKWINRTIFGGFIGFVLALFSGLFK